MKRIVSLAVVLVLASSSKSWAIVWPVTDVAALIKLQAVVNVQERIVNVVRDIDILARRFGRSISIYVDMRRYISPDPTRWRTRWVDPCQPGCESFMAALNNGDVSGTPLIDAALVMRTPVDPESDLSPAHEMQLASLDLADSSLKSGIQTRGEILRRRREELAALAAQQEDLPGHHTMAAILDKISGSSVIQAQQKSTRIALTTAILDQTIVESKRRRDAKADHLALAVANMDVQRTISVDLGDWRLP